MSEVTPPLPRTAATAPRPLAGFGTVLGFALRGMWRWRRVAPALLVATALGAAMGWVGRLDHVSDPASALWEAVNQMFTWVVPLVALVLCSGGFSSLRSDRSLVYHLVRPIGRTTLFFARYVATLPLAIAAGLACLWAAFAASGVAVPFLGWLKAGAVVVLGTVALGAVYYALSAVFRRGRIIGLVYTFFVEGMIANMPGNTQRLSLTHHLRGLCQDWCLPIFGELSPAVRRAGMRDGAEGNIASMFGQTEYLPAATELQILLVVTAVALAWGAWCIHRKDWPLKE